MVRFGPSGNSESFYEQGYKSSLEMPSWLRAMDLDAYEYNCTKGVKIGEGTARKLGEQARLNDIALSIHAPYYINMSSIDPIKRDNSIQYILSSLTVAKLMNAKRIVIHPGACTGMDRNQALKTAIETLKMALQISDEMNLSSIAISPEVMGKINQLGSLYEVLKLCLVDTRIVPTIDFGHLHARGFGSLNSLEDFENVISTMENKIGKERTANMHCHFSRIEFTKGGEKKHWRLSDTQFGPDFSLFAKVIVKKHLEPTIICESRGNMAEDALEMKNIYKTALAEAN